MNVSGRHLAIRIDGKNRVLVKDLGSTNGTYIDGRKLLAGREYILMPGEKLIVGSEDVVYRIVSQGDYDAGRK
jgi:pSer/pThr/pTyr-binding forkhead associated (FHA) protein